MSILALFSPQIPFLSVGGDAGRATRVHSGHSQWCGEYVVEDVAGDEGSTLRRLVFLSNPNVVQSEVRLITGSYSYCQAWPRLFPTPESNWCFPVSLR